MVKKCVKNVIEFHPPVARQIKGWGMSCLVKKFSLVNIWEATAAYLKSKGNMRSKFQNGKIENLMADSNSLQKSFTESVFLFLIFQLEHGLI